MRPEKRGTLAAVLAGPQRGAPAAQGRRADHLAVELSAAADRRPAGRGAGRRQPRHHQAVRADARHVGPAQAAAGGGARRRPGDGRARRPRGGRGPVPAALRPHPVHRLDRGRQEGDGGRRAEPDAGHPGARRQVPGHRARRLRSAARGGAHRARQAAQCRADLHRPRLRAGAARQDRGRSCACSARRRRRFYPRILDNPDYTADHQQPPLRAPRAPGRGRPSQGRPHRDGRSGGRAGRRASARRAAQDRADRHRRRRPMRWP